MATKGKVILVPHIGGAEPLKYPPAPLTGFVTSLSEPTVSHGQGTYVLTSSSTVTSPWAAFDGQDTGSYWQPPASSYSTTTPFAYNGTIGTVDSVANTRYAGEWLQIELPHPIILASYHLTPYHLLAYVPSTFSVFGSNNKTQWTLLHRITGFQAITRTLLERPAPVPEDAYSTYRLVVEQSAGNGSHPAIYEWTLYGRRGRTFNETDESNTSSLIGALEIGPKNQSIVSGALALANPESTFSANTVTHLRNRVLNGDMFIDSRYGYTLGLLGWGINNPNTRQRGSATITGAVYPSFLCDRWQVDTNRTNLALTYNQIDIPAAAPPCAEGLYQALQLSWPAAFSITGANHFWIGQVIESSYLADLGWKGRGTGSPIAVSFWLRTTFTGQVCVVVRNDNALASYVRPITIANTEWNKYSFMVPPCPFNAGLANAWGESGLNAGIILQFLPIVPAAKTTNVTAGGWTSPPMQSVVGCINYSTSSNGTIELTGVQLEKGHMATPFEHRNFVIEDVLCRRYFEKDRYVHGYFWANTNNYGYPAVIPFITEKRIIPRINANAGFGGIDVVKYTGIQIQKDCIIPRSSGGHPDWPYFRGFYRWEAEADYRERRYPPYALTAAAGAGSTFESGEDIASEAYGNGRYYVMHSSQASPTEGAWNMFSYNYTNRWSAPMEHYDALTGVGLRPSFIAGYTGEYAIIRVPVAFSLARFRLVNPNKAMNPFDRAPIAYRIYGSNNRSAWELLHSTEDNRPPPAWYYTEELIQTPPTSYQFYGIIVNKVNPTTRTFQIGQLELYGVDEASGSSTALVYPPIQLTSGWRLYEFSTTGHTISGQSYGNGEYKVTTTPVYSENNPAGVFSKNAADDFGSLANAFTSREMGGPLYAYSPTSPFSYLGSLTLQSQRVFDFVVSDYLGCWIKIKLPYEICPTSFAIGPRTNGPQQCAGRFRLYGSNDGTTWTTIHDQTTPLSFATNGTLTSVNITTNSYYMYYAMTVNTLAGNGQNMVITALRLNGIA